MNKRMWEIAEQAMDQGPNFHYYDPVFLAAYTELIVKECLQKCEEIRDDANVQKKSEFLTDAGKMLYEGVYGGATNCGFAIQQHFGVEE